LEIEKFRISKIENPQQKSNKIKQLKEKKRAFEG
jgi:hypothetical protein